MPHLWPTGSSLGCPPSTTARYFSAYPSDPASRRTPCPPKHAEKWLQVGLACFRLSPSCPKRLLHTFLSLRPARHYPRFWIQRSSSERRRDFNPPDLGAAQRTLRPCPTPARAIVETMFGGATSVPHGPPPITRLTLPTCRAHYPDGPERMRLSVASPLHSGLPRYSGGSASMTSLSRPAQASIALRPAGLLNRPMAAFVTRLQPNQLPGRTARQLPRSTDNSLGGSVSTGQPRRWGALNYPG